jgi:hypothetical protein
MQHFRAALAAPPPSKADLDQQAQELATAVASATPSQTGEVNKGNLITALLIVVAFVGAGIGTDAVGLSASSTALFALGTTAFGIIVGMLSGEKSTAS